MNRYVAVYQVPVYGDAYIDAETYEEAKTEANSILKGKSDNYIRFSMEFVEENMLELLEVTVLEENIDKPKQTDEEWFNEWQDELYD